MIKKVLLPSLILTFNIISSHNEFKQVSGTTLIDVFANESDITYWTIPIVRWGDYYYEETPIRISWGNTSGITGLSSDDVISSWTNAINTWNNAVADDVGEPFTIVTTPPSSQISITTSNIHFSDAWNTAAITQLAIVIDEVEDYVITGGCTDEEAQTINQTTGEPITLTGIIVNNTWEFNNDWDWTWDANPADQEIDIQTVILHELGHVLGLGHCIANSSVVMYASISDGVSKRVLTEYDLEGLHVAYLIDVVGSDIPNGDKK